jgi:hypothetical protein
MEYTGNIGIPGFGFFWQVENGSPRNATCRIPKRGAGFN